ncbi:MAG: endo-1,4-beta-xylanase [Chitinispirillaceae bacterium]|nr:endo-1,4-beta-xylanase [Chitinispirillaceae bacterium]
MNHLVHKHIDCFILLFILACFFKEIPAGTAAEDYDYSHRKRDCEVQVVAPGGTPLPGILIGIALIRNDFVFGGAIRGEAFDTLGDEYGESFLNYFDVAVPENEMKWEQVMKCSEKCDPDFSKADFLVDWLFQKDIFIRGHNLFSNEKEDGIPEWTRSLGTDAFKQAMQERIESAMGHFKGKVARWDLINEICHGENGSLPSSGMLQTKSGDPDIFSWIMDEARKTDSVAEFVINDYDLITSSDQTAADQYIDILTPLSSKFEIIGAEGHFGADMDKSSYEPKINYLAEQLGKPVWLTDVDFSFDISQAPDKIEELMRTCFANPNVGGISMGGWCQRYLPGSDLTSYFVDSLNNETPCGQRWREVRDEWKTVTGGNTDDSGKISFTGFQGKYQVLISCYFDTFDLEPGEGTKSVEVVYDQSGESVNHALAGLKIIEISINGISAPVKLPARYNRQLFLATYSLSGQQLSRSPVNPAGGKHQVPFPSSCCRVFRIETADRLPLFTGKIMAVR